MANRKKPEHKKLTRKLQVQLTEAEYEMIEHGASEDETLSAYTRRILLDCLQPTATAEASPALTHLAATLGFTDAAELVNALAIEAVKRPAEIEQFLFGARHAETARHAAQELANSRSSQNGTAAKTDVPAPGRRHSA